MGYPEPVPGTYSVAPHVLLPTLCWRHTTVSVLQASHLILITTLRGGYYDYSLSIDETTEVQEDKDARGHPAGGQQSRDSDSQFCALRQGLADEAHRPNLPTACFCQ